MPDTYAIGRRGEALAVAYLVRSGYNIIDRNVRLGRGEIDIVAYDTNRGMLVFVEVKTRSNVSSAYPTALAVHRKKRTCLRRAILAWIIKNKYEKPARTDILCINKNRITAHVLAIGSDFGICI